MPARETRHDPRSGLSGWTPELPLVPGHSGQPQEVMLNLIRNAIDAMDSVTDRARVLRVRTERDGREAIAVSVEDSGPGIDQQKLHSIFDAFVTTKPQGMGLGLAICRMIISRHEGQLSASPDEENGALLQFTLPVKSAAEPPEEMRDRLKGRTA
jgi:signal transduction histidine kinase